MAAVVALGCLAALLGAAWTTAGHVFVTLDDPLIHLALAERIALHGHYGINLGEAAAPASSILYPFLLVPGVCLGLGQAALLAWSVPAAAAAAWLFGRGLRQAGWRIDPAAGIAIGALLATAGNLVALASTGMEHALHTALTLLCLLGLLRVLQGEPAAGSPKGGTAAVLQGAAAESLKGGSAESLKGGSAESLKGGSAESLKGGSAAGWLAPAAATLMLLRYEGAALLLLTALVLVRGGRRATGALCLAAGLAGPAAFSAWLVARGLPPLPSSVLAKGGYGMVGAHSAAGNLAGMLRANLAANLHAPGFLPLVLLVAVNLAACARRDVAPPLRAFAAIGAALGAAHLLAGKFDITGRYDTYAVLAAALTAACAWRPALSAALAAAPRRRGLAALVPLAVCSHYATAPALLPIAARNNYDQQYQLRRFAVSAWAAPVGVNDIGWVSHDNPNHVLDFAGLASDEARTARATATGPDWMALLAARHGVGLVMVFPAWFPEVPADWRHVADLIREGTDAVAGRDRVAFYAVTPEAAARAAALLPGFGSTLPPHARLEIVK